MLVEYRHVEGVSADKTFRAHVSVIGNLVRVGHRWEFRCTFRVLLQNQFRDGQRHAWVRAVPIGKLPNASFLPGEAGALANGVWLLQHTFSGVPKGTDEIAASLPLLRASGCTSHAFQLINVEFWRDSNLASGNARPADLPLGISFRVR